MQTADFYSSATGTLCVNGGRDENAPAGVSLSIDDLSYIKKGSRANDAEPVTDYDLLDNKPQINNITLMDNKSLNDLGIQPKIDSSHKVSADNIDDTEATNKFATVAQLAQIETNKNNISLINHAANTSLYFTETQPTGTITVGSYWITTSGIAVYGGTSTASTYTITFTADSGTLTDWTISGNATQASTPTPASPVAVSGVGDLVESGEHSGEYDISITCGGETNHVYIADMLRKIETYADTVSKTTISRRIKKITLTGAETITGVRENRAGTAYCASFKYSSLNMLDIIDYGATVTNDNYPKYLSTHFVNKVIQSNNAYYDISNGEMGANDRGGNNTYIILCVSGLTTQQDYIDWLTTQYSNGTPVEVYYIAATATDTSITTPNIPTIDGSNTFTVGTTVNPSAVSVSYAGWTTNE